MAVTSILLDTSAYSLLMRGDRDILKLLNGAHEVYMSTIVVGELYAGFLQGTKKERNFYLLKEFLSEKRVSVVGISLNTSSIYGKIITELKLKGTPIPSNDMWIAAQSMETKATLMTTDNHFTQVNRLSLIQIDRI